MAVDRNERVMEMVEEAIRENPDVSNQELQERASEIDPRIGELSARSFNARYPLQVKRKLSAGQKEEEETTGSEEGREDPKSTLRQTLIDYAKNIAAAKDRGEVVELVENVDEYVDRVMDKT